MEEEGLKWKGLTGFVEKGGVRVGCGRQPRKKKRK
jgi:hypothetical protein